MSSNLRKTVLHSVISDTFVSDKLGFLANAAGTLLLGSLFLNKFGFRSSDVLMSGEMVSAKDWLDIGISDELGVRGKD